MPTDPNSPQAGRAGTSTLAEYEIPVMTAHCLADDNGIQHGIGPRLTL